MSVIKIIYHGGIGWSMGPLVRGSGQHYLFMGSVPLLRSIKVNGCIGGGLIRTIVESSVCNIVSQMMQFCFC